MSFNVTKTGKAREVEAELERMGEVEKAKSYNNGFARKAIDLGVALGVAAVKHASIDESKRAGVTISGHYNDDGTGSFSVSVGITQAVS